MSRKEEIIPPCICCICSKEVAKENSLECIVCQKVSAHSECVKNEFVRTAETWTCKNCTTLSPKNTGTAPQASSAVLPLSTLEAPTPFEPNLNTPNATINARFDALEKRFVEVESRLALITSQHQDLAKDLAAQKALNAGLKEDLDKAAEELAQKDLVMKRLTESVYLLDKADIDRAIARG